MDVIDNDLLFRRTAVHPPYFAFERVWRTETGVAGALVAEQPLEDEVGPIAGAEAGRHLAILGACTAAIDADDERVYYLAKKALLVQGPAWPGRGQPMHATAELLELTRRELKARAVLWAGEPIFSLDVSYQVLADRLFERTFAGFRLPVEQTLATESPYRHAIEFHSVDPVGNGLIARCGPLPPTACAGHFPGFPAWPVAIVMHSLSRLAGRALQHHLGRPCRYSVRMAQVAAERLAFAPQSLTLQADWIATDGDAHIFDCYATCGADVVGAMGVHLVVHD